MSDVMARLQTIFREVLGERGLMLTETSSPRTIPNWDSLAHLTILVAIESEFKLSFEVEELRGLETAGDLRALVERKRAIASGVAT